MADSFQLLAPSVNHAAGEIALPQQSSATLSYQVKVWLQSQGLTYVIPRVPGAFPPVKALTAARAAAEHTPAGPHPVIREMALISPLAAPYPLSLHQVYWAVVLAPRRRPSYIYYVTFVETNAPTVVGSLHHRR
jgi:hypothetical protein